MQCPRCQRENPADARFCGGCGASLAYTPQHLTDRILTSRSAIEGERKQVTVLFCDLADSTGVAERLGPDAMHALLNGFFDLALQEVHRYEGTINQFLGDGFMALFGAPLTHEDHARRAVLAALAIQRRMKDDPIEPEPGAIPLAARIGLNTGPVVVGKIGDNLRMDYTAVGDTTNLAARLQQLAEPGAIYLSEHTQRAAARWVHARPLGPRFVKGKAEPVTVYEALGLQPRAAAAVERGDRRIGSPVVGRDREVARLLESLGRVASGQGGIVSVLGEAGIGKSRLIAELRRQAAAGGPLWLEGRGLSFGRTLGYWPFLEILRSATGITDDDGERESWTKLEHGVTAVLGDQGAEVLPYLATLLGLRVPEELERRVKYLDGQAMRRQILLSSRRFFERLARQRPLVLIFEDLHWIDDSSVELLEHVLPLVDSVPLLVCLVGRPDSGGPGARLRAIAARKHGGRYAEVALSALSSPDSARLLDNLLESADLPPSLRGLILGKAEGNPYFVEEVIRALIDTGALARSETAGAWRATAAVHELAIPDTLQGVILARVDRLDEDLKTVLKLASVIGRSFFYRVLRAIAEAERELDRHLAALEQAELIRERRQAPELEYIFKHALVHEATYGTILADRRRRLHRRVAECLETLFAERLEEFYGLLAYHYSRAEQWEKAQEYLFKAGDQAGRVAADAEALAHYRQAIESYGRAFGERWDPLQRAVLERKMGEALFRRGDHTQAMEHFYRALARLAAPYPGSRWGVRLAIAGGILRQIGHRALPRLFGRRSAEPAGQAAEERLRLYELMTWIDYFVDRERAVLDALLMLNSSERSGLPAGVAEGSAVVGGIFDFVPIPWLAGRYHRRAVALAASVEQPVALGIAYLGLGFHEHLCTGDWPSALAHYRQAATAFKDAGELRGWGGATALTAALLVDRGEFRESLGRAEELVQVGRDGGDPIVCGWGLRARGWVLMFTGTLEEAVACLTSALELFAGIASHGDVVETRGLLGRCYLRQARSAEAQAELEASERLIAQHGLGGHLISSTRTGLAEAHVSRAERADGARRAEALTRAKLACRALLDQRRAVRPTEPGACRLRGTYEWLRGNPRAAEKWWRRALAAAEELGARYDLGETHLEVGRRPGRRADLERAEAIFAEIGASMDLARARQLLASENA